MYIQIAAEDPLGRAVMQRIVSDAVPHAELHFTACRGNDYLKQKFSAFATIAQHQNPVVVITDLDQFPCATALMAHWKIRQPLPAGLLFRVAVHEVESWLLADRAGFSKLFGIPQQKLPGTPDSVSDPKELVIQLARSSRLKSIRLGIAPAPGAAASKGFQYNEILTQFVLNAWDYQAACRNSDSLARAVHRIAQLAE